MTYFKQRCFTAAFSLCELADVSDLLAQLPNNKIIDNLVRASDITRN